MPAAGRVNPHGVECNSFCSSRTFSASNQVCRGEDFEPHKNEDAAPQGLASSFAFRRVVPFAPHTCRGGGSMLLRQISVACATGRG